MVDKDFLLQVHGYQLVTAQILYHMPDYPKLLQSYTWQEYDLMPRFPELKRFLDFWARELDGKLNRVLVTSAGIITPREFVLAKGEFTLH